MPVIGCLEIFQNGRSPQPITGIIYSPGPHELKIGSAVEDTLGFIPLVFNPISHYGFAPLHHCSLGVPRQFHSPRRRFACGRTSHWHAAQRGRTTATPHQNSAHIPNSARAIFALNIMRPVRLSFGSLPLPLSHLDGVARSAPF